MQQDPFGPAYFRFINKRHNALKILSWDINGFGLWHKLIESREKFPWPRLFEEDVVELTSEQLHGVRQAQHQNHRFSARSGSS